MLPPLFKRTANEGVQVWRIEVDQDKGRYRMISGLVDGAQTTSAWTQAKVKNVGRTNSVSVTLQAQREARSRWDKKLKGGYAETIEDATDASKVKFKPMLAKEYKDPNRHKEALRAAEDPLGLFSQPKLDGVRLIASRDSMMSRENRALVATPHIAEALIPLFEEHPGLILDGELYTHKLRDNFNKIVSLIKKKDPTEEQLRESAENVEYWVYDCAGEGYGDKPYAQRLEQVVQLVTEVNHAMVKFVLTDRIATPLGIDKAYERYLQAGYEGQMLRIGKGPYERNKRSSFLLKRKEYEDKEFVIDSVEEGEGNAAGAAGFLNVHERVTNIHFSSSVTGDREEREELLENADKYVGGEVTIRYNGRTPAGVPRFPRALVWHMGKREL